VDELPFGSVGVILGLKFTRTGDTLMTGQGDEADARMTMIVPPLPVMSTSVIPHSNSDSYPVQEALNALSRTDPSVRVETHEGQLLVHGLGALHLEIVERRLRDEWGVNFEFGKRRVSYRECIAPTSDAPESGTWKTLIAGKPAEIHVTLALSALDPNDRGDDAWDGNVVVDAKGRRLPGPDASDESTPISFIARGLAMTLSNSPHSALGISKTRIQVTQWFHPSHINPSFLTGAAAWILRERIQSAGMGPIMEPYVRLRIGVNEDSLGKVVKDLTENGGEVLDLEGSAVNDDELGPYPTDGVYIPPAWLSPSSAAHAGSAGVHVSMKRSVEAIAPLSRMLDYNTRLRALSGGHGTFEMSNAGFRQVSEARKLEILREIGRA
jgi:elongation factor G